MAPPIRAAAARNALGIALFQQPQYLRGLPHRRHHPRTGRRPQDRSGHRNMRADRPPTPTTATFLSPCSVATSRTRPPKLLSQSPVRDRDCWIVTTSGRSWACVEEMLCDDGSGIDRKTVIIDRARAHADGVAAGDASLGKFALSTTDIERQVAPVVPILVDMNAGHTPPGLPKLIENRDPLG